MSQKVTNSKNKIFTIATHPGSFHADDVCAVATLILLIEKKHGEAIAKKTKVIRTDDFGLMNEADFVVDVGLIYDVKKNRFDHHQKGRAGARENGVMYSSFGLVWKQYGKYLSGSDETADVIDRILVQDIDSGDNGMEFYKPIYKNTYPFRFSDMVIFERSAIESREESQGGDLAKDLYKGFLFMVEMMKRNLSNIIFDQQNTIKEIKKAQKIYNKTKNKKILVLLEDINLVRKHVPEALVMVYKSQRGNWAVRCIKTDYGSNETELQLPKSWAGTPREELAEITGVQDVVFAHPARFIATALSKEGAMKLAELAIAEHEKGRKLAKDK